jgi:hypothetical protein
MRSKRETVENTTSATFRMPDKVYNALRRQARENRTSLNTIVNQVLYAHLFDDLPRVRPMLVTLPTPLFAEMLARLPEEDVRELGKLTAEGVMKSAVLGRYGQITTDTIVDTLRITAERGGLGTFREKLDDRDIITFRHELGYKGSLFFAVQIETLSRIAGIKPEIEKTEEAVVVRF